MLKAECPQCGYTIRLSREWADLGLPTCPTDGGALTLDGGGEAPEGEVFMCSPQPAVQLT